MTTLKEIISLAKQKPNVILNTIFLIIFFSLGYMLKSMDSRNQVSQSESKAEYIKQLAEKDKQLSACLYENKIKDSLNEVKDKRFEAFVLDMNEEYKEKIDRLENATRNGKKVAKDVKRIEKSQSRIIKQLRDNE